MIDTAMISAMSGVLGSLVGSSSAVAVAWITQKTVGKRELMGAEIRKREILYGEFISKCTQVLMDSFGHALEEPAKLLPVWAHVNRIRLCSSKPVLIEAENVMRRITEQYFSPNLSLEEMRELARSQNADPLAAFGAACRAELDKMLERL
jgi:hypothetical protein